MAMSPTFQDFARLSFCTQKGAVFADSYLLRAYLGHIREGSSQNLTGKNSNQNSASKGSSQTPLDTTIDVYLQKEVMDSTQIVRAGFGRTIDAQKLAYLKQSFDENAFKILTGTAAKSGNIFGCSLAASASYSQSSIAATTAEVTSHKTQVTIAYNFPRVTVSLGSDDLELTAECKAAFAEGTTTEAMKKFLADYGEFFSSRVQLGGRLFATEEAESNTESDTSNVKKSMKAAAAVSFSGGGYGVSASTSAASQSSASTASKSASSQDKTTHIIDVIKNMRGYSQLAESLASLRDAAKEDADSVMDVLQEKNKVVVDGRFTLQLEGEIEGRYLTGRSRKYFDLKYVCNQYNNKFSASVSPPDCFANRGAILIGAASTPFTVDELKWHVCYNTPYRLQAKTDKWYLRLDSTAGIRWPYGDDFYREKSLPLLEAISKKLPETDARIVFRNADSSDQESTSQVEDVAVVTMHFCQDDDPSVQLGHAFIAGRDDHRIYLAVSKDEEKHKPVRLTIRNRDW
ncbi:hypothetical protein PG996_006155 [Apiospora saccharicola]|uniref:MACPF domain-containing protein n=1 Tax=Apiospora saccharicola TaxID=335842 RepID=A0ABR1VNR4_9PEZI